jgi:D-citramalate synthase
LYFNDLLPERFGRKRKYALGKTSVRNIEKIFKRLKLNAEDLKLVTQSIELEIKKRTVTREDTISDVLDSHHEEKK